MARKILLSGLAIIILATAVMHFPNLSVQTAVSLADDVDATTSQQMLGAAVEIVLYTPLLDEAGQPVFIINGNEKQTQYQVGEGLGTLVYNGEQTVIVTHDHWSLLDPELAPHLAKARFFNAAGGMLLEMNGDEFLNTILYRDGGTMLLNVPTALTAGLIPLTTGASEQVGWGDTVFIVYRQADGSGLAVEAMVVTATEAFAGRASYVLRSVEGKVVISGNSGGGVLHDGQLVGNMWTTAMVRDNDSGGEMTSDISRAAQLPFGS